MIEPSDVFRRLKLHHYPNTVTHSDDCALCGTEPGETVCRDCDGILKTAPQPLRLEIYRHLVSLGDTDRAEALKRTANVYQAESRTGHAVKTLRLRSKLTQKAFAERLGISQPTLSKLEKTGTGPLQKMRHRLRHLVEQYGGRMPEGELRTLCKWANIPYPYQDTDPGINRPETRRTGGPESGKTEDLGIVEEAIKTPLEGAGQTSNEIAKRGHYGEQKSQTQ